MMNPMKFLTTLLLILLMTCPPNRAQELTEAGAPADTAVHWQALGGVDGLGRVLPSHEEVGGLRQNRHVAMFYFLWHGDGTSPRQWDLSKIISRHPEVRSEERRVGKECRARCAA